MKKKSLLVLALGLMFVACDNGGNSTDEIKQGTYRTYTTVLPSNWNELTYEDANDTQILGNLVSPFFEYDYEFDESKGGKFKSDGTINTNAIVPGGFSVKYSAATKLEDVTKTVDAKWGYTDEQKEAGSYAWKITLRNDLKWDDGTPITANDFVYTMKEQLNPDFFNMRASTYYNNTPIKNARSYLYGGQLGGVANMISEAYGDDEYVQISDFKTDSDGNWTYEKDGKTYYIILDPNDGGNWGDSLALYYEYGYFDVDGWDEFIASADPITGIIKLNANNIKVVQDAIAQLHEFENVEAYAASEAGDYAYIEWEEMAYYGAELDRIDFENVGIYAPSDYELVVCLVNPIQMLKDDGSLSYLAAYNFSSLPLVKEDLYEDCKKAPQEGSTLWTTNYNSSLETTASWGPYKLTQFQSGKSYKLERNTNWYGYNLEDNKNQYNVTAIECEVISDVNTQWMSFLNGSIDDIGIDVNHKDDYRNSKYALYTPGTGTFGINIYSGLEALKKNGHNAGVLAITDFRKAIALYIDRDDFNSSVYTSNRSCYGIMGPSYYYDVENGGVYRDTQQAKEGLLSVYGFTKTDDGKWTDGKTTYPSYEEAYDAMNGMNRPLAKELLEKAYTELTTNSEKYGYDSSRQITIVYGSSTDNENVRRHYNYFVKFFDDLTKDTSFEGKIKLEFLNAGTKWAEEFKAASYEFGDGMGYSGGAFDPEGFLQCYVDPYAGLMYSENFWDTQSESFTFTMPTGSYDGAGQEFTMSVFNWYCCLNGIADSYQQQTRKNWGAGAIPEEARMTLLAALEKLILEKYYTIITTSEYSASLLGAKFSYIDDEYNTFMGFGGIRYMKVNYTDKEWEDFVKKNNNNLESEYKKED